MKTFKNNLKVIYALMAIMAFIAGYSTGYWENFIVSLIFPLATFGTVPFAKIVWKKLKG